MYTAAVMRTTFAMVAAVTKVWRPLLSCGRRVSGFGLTIRNVEKQGALSHMVLLASAT